MWEERVCLFDDLHIFIDGDKLVFCLTVDLFSDLSKYLNEMQSNAVYLVSIYFRNKNLYTSKCYAYYIGKQWFGKWLLYFFPTVFSENLQQIVYNCSLLSISISPSWQHFNSLHLLGLKITILIKTICLKWDSQIPVWCFRSLGLRIENGRVAFVLRAYCKSEYLSSGVAQNIWAWFNSWRDQYGLRTEILSFKCFSNLARNDICGFVFKFGIIVNVLI